MDTKILVGKLEGKPRHGQKNNNKMYFNEIMKVCTGFIYSPVNIVTKL
jgi:hypothetical protein